MGLRKVFQQADRANVTSSKSSPSNGLLAEAIAYLSIIQQELENRFPMPQTPPDWITKAHIEIQEAKEELKKLADRESSLKEISVKQHEHELADARQKAEEFLWDGVGGPKPPTD